MSGLFGFWQRKRKPEDAKAPEGTRVYAIGDIHGRADLLAQLHEAIAADAAAHPGSRKVLVYIGDYVDRGLQSKEVIDLVLDHRPDGFEIVCLKGNHEALMLDFLEDAQYAQVWIQNGGNATLYSYGVHLEDRGKPGDKIERARLHLAKVLPERHRRFLADLPLLHVEGDYFFVHAGVRPRVALDRQDEREMLWIRDEFLSSNVDHGKVVVHGHSISWEPDIRANRIGIDTGAFASGVLTCLVLEGCERSFLSTGR